LLRSILILRLGQELSVPGSSGGKSGSSSSGGGCWWSTGAVDTGAAVSTWKKSMVSRELESVLPMEAHTHNHIQYQHPMDSKQEKLTYSPSGSRRFSPDTEGKDM
jgi:hypothetical protein